MGKDYRLDKLLKVKLSLPNPDPSTAIQATATTSYAAWPVQQYDLRKGSPPPAQHQPEKVPLVSAAS
jgi:hypothetical protein